MTGESKQIIVGLNSYPLKDEKARADIAPEFSKSVSYAVGDYVLYEGCLYKFTSAHSAGNWSASDVAQVAIGDELSSLGETDKSIESSIAIVANGDIHSAIVSGEYVYVKNHSTLAEGLYTANSSIGADVALTVSNLTAVSKGGLNQVTDIAHGGTGASDIVNARKNLGRVGMCFSEAVFAAECTAIPQNANLNTQTYCATGKYYTSTNAVTGTLTNCPTGGMAFQMLVFNLLDDETGPMVDDVWVSRTRVIMAYTGDIYVQLVVKNRTTFTYGAWRKIAMA